LRIETSSVEPARVPAKETKDKDETMKVIILGCGRVGARLAQLLEAEGHEISIIDPDPEAFDRLPETFRGTTTLGTGIDVDVLKAAGIEDADAFAAVTNFDNTNIMACQVAKEIFGVDNVLARIYDPGRESLYHELGLETVCPTTLVSTKARDLLLHNEGVESNDQPIGEQIQEGRPGEAARIASALGAAAPSPGTATVPVRPVQKRDENDGRGLRRLFKH
jgi:trk system potassium uptake protein TrkA